MNLSCCSWTAASISYWFWIKDAIEQGFLMHSLQATKHIASATEARGLIRKKKEDRRKAAMNSRKYDCRNQETGRPAPELR